MNLNLIISIKFGSGNDGICYTLDDKILKICANANIYNLNNLNYLRDNPDPAYAKVYEIQYLDMFAKNDVDYIVYYYIMEKLNNISEDEKKVFFTILSHEDKNIKKDYSSSQLKKILDDLSRGLDIEPSRIMLFCERLRDSKLKHLDISERNILVDGSGNYKLIDFERIELCQKKFQK